MRAAQAAGMRTRLKVHWPGCACRRCRRLRASIERNNRWHDHVTRHALPRLLLPGLLLGGLLLAWATGSMTASVASGHSELGPLPTVQAQISHNARTRQLCEQIIAGKLRVRWHRGEVTARRECKRDGW